MDDKRLRSPLKAWSSYACLITSPLGIYAASTASMRGRLWQLLLTEGATQAPVMIVENIHQIAGLFKRIPQGVEGPQFQFLRSNYLEDLFAADKIFACEK